jgi:hypothetical protein
MTSTHGILAATCIEIYNSQSESLVEEYLKSYLSYIGFSLIVCFLAVIPLLQKLCGDSSLRNPLDVSLALHIPFLPNFDLLLFLAPVVLAISNAFLLAVRVNDVQARPFFYMSPQQFAKASLSSKLFTAYFVVAPIGTLFSSLSRMTFMFRLLLLCQKIGAKLCPYLFYMRSGATLQVDLTF